MTSAADKLGGSYAEARTPWPEASRYYQIAKPEEPKMVCVGHEKHRSLQAPRWAPPPSASAYTFYALHECACETADKKLSRDMIWTDLESEDH